AGLERLQELDLAARQDRHRQPVAIEQAVAGEGREPRARRHDADEVERIGRREGNLRTGCRLAPGLAQGAYGIGQGELLTREAGDEAAAANLAARFEPAIHLEQLPPGRQ